LEYRMNLLASQVAAQQVTKETKVLPPLANVDEEVLGREVEEDILKETFISLFLSSERLEEVHWMQGEEDQGMIGAKPAGCWCKSARRWSTAGYEQNKGRVEKWPTNYRRNADINM
ncbi:hypothetical protein HAX54_043662, partial [Datura stramonium]|nr:hypothetical protein [Datura stramonium]